MIDTLSLFWIYRKRSWDSSFDFQSHLMMNVRPSILCFLLIFLYSVCLSNDESHKSMELIMCIKFCFFSLSPSDESKIDGMFSPWNIFHPNGCAGVCIHYMCHFALLSQGKIAYMRMCLCAFVNVNEHVKRALHWQWKEKNHEHTRGHASTLE